MRVSIQLLFSRRWISGLTILILTIASYGTAQAGKRTCAGAPTGGATPCSWRFTFGTANPHPGYAQVHPTIAYTLELGYGFANAPALDASSQSVCSDGKPFLFSADVPEGNYDVTLGLGGASDSTTTVKAEARRLLVDRVQVPDGKVVMRTFTINVRSPKLASGEVVRLKKDEQNEFDWDGRLTLEFNNAHPCVSSLRIERNDRAITVYIAGDSTVTDQRREPWAAWGQMLPRFFKAGVAIANHAESGESLKSFIGEKRLPKVLETIRAGDYLFIQFAHNDQKPGASHVDAFTTYQEYLKRYIEEARKKGAIPVLVTSMHRRDFDDANKIVNTLGDYPEAMRQLAKAENVALIDLNAMSKILFEALGPEGTLKAFVHFPAGTFPGQDAELKDNTHFTAYGAYELARCIVEGIWASKLGLGKHLVKDAGHFNPAHPDPVSNWSLPPSPFVTEMKPEGN